MNDKTAAQDLEIWSRGAVFYFPCLGAGKLFKIRPFGGLISLIES